MIQLLSIWVLKMYVTTKLGSKLKKPIANYACQFFGSPINIYITYTLSTK